MDLDFGISVDIGPALESITTDVLIIGTGPAGLAAAIYTARAGLDTVVVGKQTESYLSKGYLIENYPGIPSIKGADLLKKFIEHAQIFGAKIIETEVTDFVLGDSKLITTKKNAISAVTVIIATGKGTARKKLIPGEASLLGMGVGYCATCDGPLYRGREVVAIGNSNEAAEDVLMLHQMGCKVIWILDDPDDLKVSPELVKEIKELNIPINETAIVKEIMGQDKVESIVIENDKGEMQLNVDAVFIFKAIPMTPLFQKAGLKIEGRNCIEVDRMQQTNISGVFAAGDITCGGMQIITAAGEGAVAGMQAIKYVRKQKRE
jgi:thioredoxin reductase (NADPH)